VGISQMLKTLANVPKGTVTEAKMSPEQKLSFRES